MRFNGLLWAALATVTINASACALVPKPEVDPRTGQIDPGYWTKASGLTQIGYAVLQGVQGAVTYNYGAAVTQSAKIQARTDEIKQEIVEQYQLCLSQNTAEATCRQRAIADRHQRLGY